MPTIPTTLVLGRFPPPLDGQTLATRRLADLLAAVGDVRRVNTSPGEDEHAQSQVRFRLDRVRHYLSLRHRIKSVLAEAPAAPVLWTSVSPAPLGHLRDLLTVLPAFCPEQPVYGVVHWGNFDRLFRSPLTRLTASVLVRRVAGFVFLNEHLAARCTRWIPASQRFVIPNTVDDAVLCTDEEVAAQQTQRAERAALRLLFLSNMTPSKGYADVLEAVRLLRERNISLHADFVGRWETEGDRRRFEEAVRNGDLSDVVVHHGGVHDRQRIKQMYLNADLFLLPTYYPTEAQPLTIIEAINAGTPVIATRHASIPDMVRHEREALLVPPHDPAAIASAVERLSATSTWRAFSERARTRFLTHFSPEAVRQQWIHLLSGNT